MPLAVFWYFFLYPHPTLPVTLQISHPNMFTASLLPDVTKHDATNYSIRKTLHHHDMLVTNNQWHFWWTCNPILI